MKLVTLIGHQTNWGPLGALLAAPSVAVRVLQKCSPALVPAIRDTTDVFVMDIDVDDMLAADFVRAIRTSRPAAQVLVAAENSHPDRLTVLEAGAAGLLRSPVDALELVAAVHGFFGRSSGTAVSDILDALPAKIALIDATDNIVFANREAASFWSFPAGGGHRLSARDAVALADVKRRLDSGASQPPVKIALGGSAGRPHAHLALVGQISDTQNASDLRLLFAMPEAGPSAKAAQEDTEGVFAQLRTLIREAEARRLSCALHTVHVGGLAEANRTYGRIVGDRMMEVLAQRLATLAAAQNLILGRIAGDEFALLQSADRPQDMVIMADAIFTIADELVDCAGQMLDPRVSLGIASFPRDGQDAASLVRAAKHALLRARSEGASGSVAFSSPPVSQAAPADAGQSFREALLADRLELHYQPQIDLKTGRYDGVEALLRWSRGDQGDVPPREILAVAERENLLDALTAWICQRLDHDRTRLQEAGLAIVRLSLHLSVEQLKLPRLPNLLTALRGVAGEEIDILVAVGALADPEAGASLARLRDLEFGVCLRFSDADAPTEVNAQFVSKLKIDARDEKGLDQMFQHAREHALPVIGANIEEATQLVALRERGCEVAQGYYIQAPVSLMEMISILRSDLLP